MPDDTWNTKGLNIPLRRPFEIFIPNVCAIDMDTTGTWPFGRRPKIRSRRGSSRCSSI